MKEYIAETGGRYTYSDDILNLQELALSMSAVFDGCSDFIISGCEIEGPRVSPGYVWLGGKVRRFDGCADAVYPHILYRRSSAVHKRLMIFVQSCESHTYDPCQDHQPDSSYSIHI